jgi:hypothetical protein
MLNPTTCSVTICFLSFKISETEAARREREREKLINANQRKSHLSKKNTTQMQLEWSLLPSEVPKKL